MDQLVDMDSVLISGPAFSGRRQLFHQILGMWGANALIISTRKTADHVQLTHRQRCTTTDESPELLIVDTLSNALDRPTTDTSQTKYAQHPSNLVSIGTKFTSILGQHENKDLSVGITTIDPLLVYASASDVFDFLTIIIQKSTVADFPVVATVDPDAHDETTIAQLVSLFDAVVETRRTTDERQEYRIQHPHSTKWCPVTQCS